MVATQPVYYNDGCVRHADYVYLSCKLKSVDPDEYDFSRMTFHKAPQWAKHDLNWNVVAVCTWHSHGQLCSLSNLGEVTLADRAGIAEEKIADVESLGAVKQIREIGGLLHVCGDQGQVYRRQSDGSWVHIDAGILDREIKAEALDLNGIDGTSLEDIYVVGMHGRVLHFDGSAWAALDSATYAHLERVHCVSPDEAYACGNRGAFLPSPSAGSRT